MTTANRRLLESAGGVIFRVDSFSVPEAARKDFDTAMRRNLAFIETLPGFRGHMVLEKIGGATAFNVVTIAAWESAEAHDQAAARVRSYYEEIGFDLPATLARWGVRAEPGHFRDRSAA
jgi:heme-degrading monooxygenase HmoA